MVRIWEEGGGAVEVGVDVAARLREVWRHCKGKRRRGGGTRRRLGFWTEENILDDD